MTVMCFHIFPFLATAHTLIIFVQHIIPCLPSWSFLLYHFNHLHAWRSGIFSSSLPCLSFGRTCASLLYIIHQLLETHTNITLINLLNTQRCPSSEILLASTRSITVPFGRRPHGRFHKCQTLLGGSNAGIADKTSMIECISNKER
ncbi:uncharacterized protein P174DRAFT_145088 [Aspergillus novofumigatus IBT 16806]|uniref:Uncharacterized protein n=1 Tax=Aspergillus novofumigatus (strain IBT 16806) TaxID=1392255 RepID=A0A2I1CDT7_ASPN1|nr:uncharacterized protein P174DRAFT_145088 [Aspergillus novofumigatus IBT 16806]PKX95778.1 hypothetical protein P174DRAFT_145088 [Aspergillus novofumigatus IBT 16806]